MYAVIRTGGKQYHVAPDQIIEIEKIPGSEGDIVELGEVLLVGGDKPQIGAPLVSGACVGAQIIEQRRGPKIIVFKKKRRQNYRRKRGHRQELTAIRITEILTGGKKPSKDAGKPLPRKVEKFPTPKKSAAVKAAEPVETEAGAAPENKAAPEKKKAEKKAPAKKAAPEKKAEASKADAPKAAEKKATEKKPAAKKPAAKKPAKK
ncbi:MAG: 50S ribosomal protein L21 [Hyphomicrobiales bacterium]